MPKKGMVNILSQRSLVLSLHAAVYRQSSPLLLGSSIMGGVEAESREMNRCGLFWPGAGMSTQRGHNRSSPELTEDHARDCQASLQKFPPI